MVYGPEYSIVCKSISSSRFLVCRHLLLPDLRQVTSKTWLFSLKSGTRPRLEQRRNQRMQWPSSHQFSSSLSIQYLLSRQLPVQDLRLIVTLAALIAQCGQLIYLPTHRTRNSRRWTGPRYYNEHFL